MAEVKGNDTMNAIGIIPARYHSTRFEGKVLADLCGKPVIQHVYENAKKARILDDLVVACDDERILKVVEQFGGKVTLTAKGHETGTDRLSEVVQPLEVKVVANIQADEPFVRPEMLHHLVSALLEDKKAVMATLMVRIHNSEEIRNPNVVKVVTDKHGYALYFSRTPIPYYRDEKAQQRQAYFKHLGFYSYTKDFLFTFRNLPSSKLEKAEKLEQLRVLEHGYKIRVIETPFNTIGIDTPQDLEMARKKMQVETIHA